MTDPQRLNELDQQVHLFALPGWRYIEEDLTKRLEDCTNRIVYGEGVSVEERERLRGKAIELKRLLELPEETRKDRDYEIEQMEQEAAQESE